MVQKNWPFFLSMTSVNKILQPGKKAYFASDFHLGSPNWEASRKRENKIVRWLDSISHDCQYLFLVGDLFDFWFEYPHVIPKGFVRFQGKLAELADKGVELHIFTGNHDMWMFGYFEKELGAVLHREPIRLALGSQVILVGHGDGLGPGDRTYKFLKNVFANPLCQWTFSWLHPNIGMWIANKWSGHSRLANHKDEVYKGDNEWLWQYCKEVESHTHHDYYIFGHRHLHLDLEVGDKARYINVGEWYSGSYYIETDGLDLSVNVFESK
jgi:UDP-2,3-diacylglucosamine hydrolase